MAGKLKALQLWCKTQCEGYRDVNITNMTTSWKSGLAFCAIIHRFNPELIDYHNLSKENVYENCKLAFDSGQRLGIPALLDPEDMVIMEVPDKLCIITYVSQYYNYFKDKPQLGGPNADKNKLSLKRSIFSVATDQPEKKKQQIIEKPKGRRSTYGDTCTICEEKVYLIERHIDNQQLYHRLCFRQQQKSESKPLSEKQENAIEDQNNVKESKFRQNGMDIMEVDSNDEIVVNGNDAYENLSNNKSDTNRYNLRARQQGVKHFDLKHFDNKVELNRIDSKDNLVFNEDDKSKKSKPFGGRPATMLPHEKDDTSKKMSNSSDSVSNLGNRKYDRRPSADSAVILSNKKYENNKSASTANLSNRKYERRTSVELNNIKNTKKDNNDNETSRINLKSTSHQKRNEDILNSNAANNVPKKIDIKIVSKDSPPLNMATTANSTKNEEDPSKTEWQLEAERRRLMRKGKYEDPEKAKLRELRNKDKSSNNISPLKTDKNSESNSPLLFDDKKDYRHSSSPEFIECDEHGNPVVNSKSLGNISSQNETLKTVQIPSHYSLSALKTEQSKISHTSNNNVKYPLTKMDKSPLNIMSKSPSNIRDKSPSKLLNKSPSNIANKSPSNMPNKSPSNLTYKEPIYITSKSNVDVTNISPIPPDRNKRMTSDISNKSLSNINNKSPKISKKIDDSSPSNKQLDKISSDTILSKFNMLAKHSSTQKVIPNVDDKNSLHLKTNNDIANKSTGEKKIIMPYMNRLNEPSPTKMSEDKSKNIHSINISPLHDKEKYQPKSSIAEDIAKHSTLKLNDNQSKVNTPVTTIDKKYNLRKIISPLETDFDDFYTDLNVRRESVDSDASCTSTKSEILPIVPVRRYKSRSNSLDSLESFDTSRRPSLVIRPLPPLPDDDDDRVVNYNRRPSISAEKPIPVQDILNELLTVDAQLQQLEREGIILEQQIRSVKFWLKKRYKFCQDTVKTGEMEDDELMIKWFNLVNNKNALVRKECDLMYKQRQQELEEQHTIIDYELRSLIKIPETEKSESQKLREEELIKMLFETVSLRDHIINSIEEDRLRYLEEDQEIADMMQLKGFIKADIEKGKLKTKKMKKDKKRKKFSW